MKIISAVLFLVALAAPAVAGQRPLAAHALPVPVPQYLAQIINDASAKYGVDPNLVASMAFKESRYDARAVSRLGAQGIMQLTPRTAKHLGVTDAFDARQNVFGGVKYLRTLLDQFDGNVDYALAAYNAGPTLVAKVGPKATDEAVEYVATIRKYYAAALAAL